MIRFAPHRRSSSTTIRSLACSPSETKQDVLKKTHFLAKDYTGADNSVPSILIKGMKCNSCYSKESQQHMGRRGLLRRISKSYWGSRVRVELACAGIRLLVRTLRMTWIERRPMDHIE